MGTPKLNISAFGFGAPLARTLAGPPDKTIPLGFNFFISLILVLKGKTFE